MSNTKLKNLTHYILTKCDEEKLLDKLGSIKLNKILWFIDTAYFRMKRESLSGVDVYLKMNYGPVPKNIVNVLDTLEQEGEIKIYNKEFYGYLKRHFTVLKPFSENKFSDEQKVLIDSMVKEICDEHTADSISELSHTVIWEDAPMRGEIPVYACLAENVGEITSEILKKARKFVKENHKNWKSNIKE